jgi:hypothetical protein
MKNQANKSIKKRKTNEAKQQLPKEASIKRKMHQK